MANKIESKVYGNDVPLVFALGELMGPPKENERLLAALYKAGFNCVGDVTEFLEHEDVEVFRTFKGIGPSRYERLCDFIEKLELHSIEEDNSVCCLSCEDEIRAHVNALRESIKTIELRICELESLADKMKGDIYENC